MFWRIDEFWYCIRVGKIYSVFKQSWRLCSTLRPFFSDIAKLHGILRFILPLSVVRVCVKKAVHATAPHSFPYGTYGAADFACYE